MSTPSHVTDTWMVSICHIPNILNKSVISVLMINGMGHTLPTITGWWLQYIPRNMHTVFALLCFVVVIHWLIFPYPSGLLHWHCGNLTIAPVPAKQPWWIWINTSCEFIMNDCITTTKQSTTKPCAYFLGYTVYPVKAITTVVPFQISWLMSWQHKGQIYMDFSLYPCLKFNRCLTNPISKQLPMPEVWQETGYITYKHQVSQNR